MTPSQTWTNQHRTDKSRKIFPFISGLVWLGTLLGLFLHWSIDTSERRYASEQDGQTIAYISDVGASELKPLFVVGCILTTVFLDASFIADRLLRHKGRLVPNTTLAEKVLSGVSIFFAFVGTIGLTFLSGFDTLRYPRLHNVFLVLFIGGYLISAILLCVEFLLLGRSKRLSPSPLSHYLFGKKYNQLTRLFANRLPPTPHLTLLLLGQANVRHR